MMIYGYAFALALGAVLLVGSLLMGGDHDNDATLDVEAAGGADTVGDGELHGSLEGFAASFLSFRFWTFFATVFGAIGLSLDGLKLVESPSITLLLALPLGAFSGFAASTMFRRLAGTDIGTAATSSDYVGKAARVLLPVEPGTVGKIRLQLKGTTVDLLARGAGDESFVTDTQVLVLEMQDTQALVTKLPTSDTRALASEESINP
jgi:membrane protein implicated in regulation of membrane protease activity